MQSIKKLNNSIYCMNIEGFAFFSTGIMSVKTSYDILEGFVLRNFQNDN